MKKSLILTCLLVLMLAACNRGEDPVQPRNDVQTEVIESVQPTQTAPSQALPTPPPVSLGIIRYSLTGDMVCGTGRTVNNSYQTFVVENGEVVQSATPSVGGMTTGSSVFAQGSLYVLSNRYCSLNNGVYVRASDIGNALDQE